MKKSFFGIVLMILIPFTISGGAWADEAKPAETASKQAGSGGVKPAPSP